jgi:hypothetical protein
MKRWIQLLIAALLLSVGAKAQQTWFTQALYKGDSGRIEARSTINGIVFSFEKNYPPPSLPYRYLSSTPKDGLLPFHIIYTQNGATRDWSDLRLEFAIELIGGEVAGTYAVQTYFGAIVQP